MYKIKYRKWNFKLNEIKDKEDLYKDWNYNKQRENEQINLLENRIKS